MEAGKRRNCCGSFSPWSAGQRFAGESAAAGGRSRSAPRCRGLVLSDFSGKIQQHAWPLRRGTRSARGVREELWGRGTEDRPPQQPGLPGAPPAVSARRVPRRQGGPPRQPAAKMRAGGSGRERVSAGGGGGGLPPGLRALPRGGGGASGGQRAGRGPGGVGRGGGQGAAASAAVPAPGAAAGTGGGWRR